jgi:riboflavin biosynthesis pyrimidine reductase
LVAGDDPQPIILDSRLRTPPTAHVLKNQRAPWLATTLQESPSETISALQLSAARVQILPVVADRAGQVSLPALLSLLAAKGIRSIMVEGGATVLSHFLQAGLANAAVVTVAPIFVGGLHAMAANGTSPHSPADFPTLSEPQFIQLGHDIVYYGHFCQAQP